MRHETLGPGVVELDSLRKSHRSLFLDVLSSDPEGSNSLGVMGIATNVTKGIATNRLRSYTSYGCVSGCVFDSGESF